MHRFRSTLGKGKCVGQNEKASSPISIRNGKIGLGFLSSVCLLCVFAVTSSCIVVVEYEDWESGTLTLCIPTYPCVCNISLCVMNLCCCNMDGVSIRCSQMWSWVHLNPLLPHSPQHLEPVRREQFGLFFKLFGQNVYILRMSCQCGQSICLCALCASLPSCCPHLLVLYYRC